MKYITEPTEHHIKRYTFSVITDIGVTREFNRHRTFSVAEQSTRYCDLTKDKFFILAAEDYYKYLIGQNRIENYELPYESEITKTQPANNSTFSKLYSYLSQTKKSYCDDCLSKLTGISPRQQINQLCNKNSKVIHRDDYGKCFNCSKYKIVRFI